MRQSESMSGVVPHEPRGCEPSLKTQSRREQMVSTYVVKEG